jgi:hypothetical protein
MIASDILHLATNCSFRVYILQVVCLGGTNGSVSVSGALSFFIDQPARL